MKIKEFIAELQKFDPELGFAIFDEYDGVVDQNVKLSQVYCSRCSKNSLIAWQRDFPGKKCEEIIVAHFSNKEF